MKYAITYYIEFIIIYLWVNYVFVLQLLVKIRISPF